VYLFDTNALKLVFLKEENTLKRVEANFADILVSSVVIEELMMVYMGSLNRARSKRNSLSLPRAHEDFAQVLGDLRTFPIFVYSPEAEAIFNTFPPSIIRIGAQDCRIAAQAMAEDMTVITRNLRDFEAIGAKCEDWSAP
jgi:predicted nucleic acid-binding protein